MNETEGNPWLEVQAAVLPAREVAALAPLRARSGLRLYIHEDRVWVRWPGDGDDIVQILLPVPGVEFFTTRAGNWFRFGSLLPVTMPRWDGDGLPATVVLLPQPIAASAPITEEYFPPLMLRIVRGGEPQAVTALSCSLHELQRWADTATSREIAGVRGALCEARALLLGPRLPTVPGGTRYWGEDLFVPIGFRPEPDLAPVVLREAVGADPDEYVFLTDTDVALVPKDVFQPLTRAGIRLAMPRGPE